MVKHLVAFIKDKDTNTSEAENLVANQGVETARGSDDDVRASVLVLNDLDILLDWSTAVEHASLDVGHILAETVVLVANLESQLASVAHNKDGDLAINGLDLLKGGQDKDCSLSETGLGLADNITSEEGLGNTGLLDCTFDRTLDSFP